jgi:hypothetical protein
VTGGAFVDFETSAGHCTVDQAPGDAPSLKKSLAASGVYLGWSYMSR